MRDDEGSAALEFITVGVILLVPLVYLIIALGAIQEQMLGVEAVARHTARVIALAPDEDAAVSRSECVLVTVSEQYGIDPDSTVVSVSCTPAAAGCPSAGALVTVTVASTVSLPMVPAVLGLQDVATVAVEGSSTQKVSRLWGSG